MMKLAGVVVLYNPEDDVVSNIHSYLNSLDVLYVVDNSSYDNKNKFKDKKMEYISNGRNLGIAAALNIGAKKAIKDGFEWLLTMDQDSSFNKNAVEEMLEFLEKLKKEEFVQKISSTKYEKVGLISPFHRTAINTNEKPKGIDMPLNVMTSGNIINLKAYQKVGGFKDWLFIDAVDFDYCLNLRNYDYEVVRLNYIQLEHHLGNTVFKKVLFKQMYSLNHSAMRRYYIVRNRHYLYDLYKNEFPDYCKLEKSRTKREVIKIILCEKQRLKKILAMIQGYIDYKKGITGEKDFK